jgi:hypothetical protein
MFLFDFFDGLVSCASKNICDREVTQALFQNRANELYEVLYQYIAWQRTQMHSNDFGMGIEKVAKGKFD